MWLRRAVADDAVDARLQIGELACTHQLADDPQVLQSTDGNHNKPWTYLAEEDDPSTSLKSCNLIWLASSALGMHISHYLCFLQPWGKLTPESLKNSIGRQQRGNSTSVQVLARLVCLNCGSSKIKCMRPVLVLGNFTHAELPSPSNMRIVPHFEANTPSGSHQRQKGSANGGAPTVDRLNKQQWMGPWLVVLCRDIPSIYIK
jgi:hypothetical protein